MKDFSSHARRRFTADERAKFVALCRQSDLTQSAFARQYGIKLGTLQQWLCRLKTQPASVRPGFQELIVPLTSSPWAAEIRLSPEITVQLDSHASVCTNPQKSDRPIAIDAFHSKAVGPVQRFPHKDQNCAFGRKRDSKHRQTLVLIPGRSLGALAVSA